MARRIAIAFLWLWASPWTLPGLLVGLLGLVTGGGAQRRGRVLEFYGGAVAKLLGRLPIRPMGLTLGHVILGQSPAALQVVRPHEMVHVAQYERWGPAFVPAYLACSALLWLRRKDGYRDNPFEREAFEKSSPSLLTPPP